MNDIMTEINTVLKKREIAFALLDRENDNVRILISADNKKSFITVASENGWKKIKDKSKDIYLYGMDHFLYYRINGAKLTVCFQLACRSTLNGEWVPLDRKINNYALERIVKTDGQDIFEPMPEDFLCYLLAKCVYTETGFSDYDRERIVECKKRWIWRLLCPS